MRNTKHLWISDKPFFCNTSKASSIPHLDAHDKSIMQNATNYNRSLYGGKSI